MHDYFWSRELRLLDFSKITKGSFRSTLDDLVDRLVPCGRPVSWSCRCARLEGFFDLCLLLRRDWFGLINSRCCGTTGCLLNLVLQRERLARGILLFLVLRFKLDGLFDPFFLLKFRYAPSKDFLLIKNVPIGL